MTALEGFENAAREGQGPQSSGDRDALGETDRGRQCVWPMSALVRITDVVTHRAMSALCQERK